MLKSIAMKLSLEVANNHPWIQSFLQTTKIWVLYQNNLVLKKVLPILVWRDLHLLKPNIQVIKFLIKKAISLRADPSTSLLIRLLERIWMIALVISRVIGLWICITIILAIKNDRESNNGYTFILFKHLIWAKWIIHLQKFIKKESLVKYNKKCLNK